MMDTDHHNFKLPPDWYVKRNQYCCPPMPWKTSLFWDFWQTIWKQMGCPDVKHLKHFIRNDVIFRYVIFEIENDSIWCLKERFVQIFPDSISFKSFTEINYFAHTFYIFCRFEEFLWRIYYDFSHSQSLWLIGLESDRQTLRWDFKVLLWSRFVICWERHLASVWKSSSVMLKSNKNSIFKFYWGRNSKNFVYGVCCYAQNSAESGTVHFYAFHLQDLFHHCNLFWRKVSEISIFIDGAMKTKSSCGHTSSNDGKDETKIHCWKIVDCWEKNRWN